MLVAGSLIGFEAFGITFLLGAEFDNVITTGQIVIALLVGVGALVGIIFGVRYRVVAEAALKLSDARGEALGDAKEREADLQEGLAASREANAQLREQIESLKALPNLTRVIEVMTEANERLDRHAQARFETGVEAITTMLDERFAAHEKSASERHGQSLATGAELLAAVREFRGEAR